MKSGRSDCGQATVELVLVLPFLAALLLLLVQVGLVVRAHILVVNAAREAARTAAVESDASAVSASARASTSLEPGRMLVRVVRRGPPGGAVTVEVAYEAPTDVPIVGKLLPDVRLSSTATMRVEDGLKTAP